MQGSMEGQQFCLRWHNFQNTLLSSLPKLLDGGYLTDVTLSAGGRHIHAHRIILSACSYYFKELFKDLSALQHPVIVLPGMEYANLCALVTFMYNGEVNIYQDQLPALLAMADTLHIRGLADIAGTSSRQDNGMFTHLPPTVGASSVSTTGASSATATATATTTTTTASSPSSSSSSVHHVAPTVIPTKQEDGDPKESIRIKEEAKENPESVSSMQFDENLEEDSANEQESVPYCVKTKPYYSINAKLNQREKIVNTSTKLMEKSSYVESAINDIGAEERENPLMDGLKATGNSLDASMRFLTNTASNRSSQGCNKTSVTCLICGKQLSNQYNLRVHMETHSNSSYSCTACSHVSRSRDALRKHVSYRHPVAAPQKRSRYSSSKS